MKLKIFLGSKQSGVHFTLPVGNGAQPLKWVGAVAARRLKAMSHSGRVRHREPTSRITGHDLIPGRIDSDATLGTQFPLMDVDRPIKELLHDGDSLYVQLVTRPEAGPAHDVRYPLWHTAAYERKPRAVRTITEARAAKQQWLEEQRRKQLEMLHQASAKNRAQFDSLLGQQLDFAQLLLSDWDQLRCALRYLPQSMQGQVRDEPNEHFLPPGAASPGQPLSARSASSQASGGGRVGRASRASHADERPAEEGAPVQVMDPIRYKVLSRLKDDDLAMMDRVKGVVFDYYRSVRDIYRYYTSITTVGLPGTHGLNESGFKAFVKCLGPGVAGLSSTQLFAEAITGEPGFRSAGAEMSRGQFLDAVLLLATMDWPPRGASPPPTRRRLGQKPKRLPLRPEHVERFLQDRLVPAAQEAVTSSNVRRQMQDSEVMDLVVAKKHIIRGVFEQCADLEVEVSSAEEDDDEQSQSESDEEGPGGFNVFGAAGRFGSSARLGASLRSGQSALEVTKQKHGSKPSLSETKFEQAMSLSAFLACLRRLGLLEEDDDDAEVAAGAAAVGQGEGSDELTVIEARLAFVMAQSEDEEAMDEEAMAGLEEMDYSEFVEAMGHVALAKWEGTAEKLHVKLSRIVEMMAEVLQKAPEAAVRERQAAAEATAEVDGEAEDGAALPVGAVDELALGD